MDGEPDPVLQERQPLRPVRDRDSFHDLVLRRVDACDLFGKLTLTHTASGSTAMASGPSPTSIVAVTAFVRGSMREDGAVQRVRNPHGARGRTRHRSARCPLLTILRPLVRPGIDADDAPARLVRDPDICPHRRRCPAQARRSGPVHHVATNDLRADCVPPALVTQTAPSPKATAVGVTPTRIAWTSWFVCGSICARCRPIEFATQTIPSPNAIPLGSPPTSMRWRLAARTGIDARHCAVERVRHPHRAFADCDARRSVADRDLVAHASTACIDHSDSVCRYRSVCRAAPCSQYACDRRRGHCDDQRGAAATLFAEPSVERTRVPARGSRSGEPGAASRICRLRLAAVGLQLGSWL